MKTSELDYELPGELIAQARSLAATPRACSSTTAGRARPGAGPFPTCRTSYPTEPSSSSTTPASCRPGCTCSALVGERPRSCSSSGATASSGRRSPVPAAACGRERLAPPKARAAGAGGNVELLESLGGGRWLVRLAGDPAGEPPLPPYIRTRLDDPERYQTVYAEEPGLRPRRRPGSTSPRSCFASSTWSTSRFTWVWTRFVRSRPTSWKRTTSTASATGSTPRPGNGSGSRARHCGRHDDRAGARDARRRWAAQGPHRALRDPRVRVRRVDALVTNFHLPRSSLLALVMAFAGVDETRALYEVAVAERIASTPSATRCLFVDAAWRPRQRGAQ